MIMNHIEVGDYVGESRIGTGSFAEVWKGYHKITKKPVAIKVVDLDRLSRNHHSNENKLKQNLNSEMKIMKASDHKNIVKMFDFEESTSQMTMILELCEGGDFSKYIRKHKRLSERRAKYFMQQLASGLEFLRLEGIIHRDLKPQNLLLSDNSDKPILKIADFGFARYIDTQSLAHTLCGSPLYMAPEIFKMNNYTVKADLWSVGIILYEALTGAPPFEAKNLVSLMQAIDSTDHIKFPPHVQISSNCNDLIRGLLQRDPNQRISWEQFFLHPWLNSPSHQPPQQQQIPQPLIPPPSSSQHPQHPQPSQPSQPSSHAHLPLLHSKSQPIIPPPARNFLHDDRILQQNIFNAFSNIPSSSSSSSSSTSAHSNSNSNNSTLPRSHSTSVLPSYKLAPLSSPGNSAVASTSSTSTSTSSSLTRNTPPDSKNFQRHAGFNVNTNSNSNNNPSAFTGPSSLPNSLSYPRYSSSPPKGSTLSNPTISPNTSLNSQKLPYSLAPISASPPTTNFSSSGSGKTVSFADNTPYKPPFSDKRSTSNYQSRTTRPTYSQKQFLVPKFSAANSDSFEKDCVILQNSDPSIEGQVIEEIEARYKRAFAVSDLGDLKIEAELPYEAFSVYIRGVEQFCQTLEFAKSKAKENNLTCSPKIIELLNEIKEKASLYIKTVEFWKSVLQPSEVVPNADQIIYYHALYMGRLAALDESLNAFSKSEEVYYIAILLLESILIDDCDPDDRVILQKFIGSFSRRLATVQSKKEYTNK